MEKEIDLRIESKNALNDAMLVLGYKNSGGHIGNSFVYDCTFFETGIGDVYITDYDITKDISLNDKTYIAFSTKTGKQIRINLEFLINSKNIIEEELIKLNN